jgi:gamma-glutamylputrescine oxidase
VGTGQRLDEETLEALLGADAAHRLFDLAEAAKRMVRDRIARHRIDCDLRVGQVIAAAKRRHAEPLRRRGEKLARDYGYRAARWLGRDELRAAVASDAFNGGLRDDGAFHLHPLNYALGLALACDEAGVRIYERSAALGYDSARVRTATAGVAARQVVVACDAYLGRLEPRIAGRMMPINNFMVATAPLGEAAHALLRDGVCVHDTRFVVNYFRLSPDGRLLFGGGETYRRRFPADIAAFVRPHLLAIFPQLDGVGIDHAWGGALGISRTRLPHVGRLPPNVWFAQGFSGHGISIATLAGAVIAEAATGASSRFDLLARLPSRPWPGGTLLRAPLLALGMLWYALRDRL